MPVPNEGTPNFETVVQAYEKHAASGVDHNVHGKLSIAPKGSTFVASTGKVRYGGIG